MTPPKTATQLTMTRIRKGFTLSALIISPQEEILCGFSSAWTIILGCSRESFCNIMVQVNINTASAPVPKSNGICIPPDITFFNHMINGSAQLPRVPPRIAPVVNQAARLFQSEPWPVLATSIAFKETVTVEKAKTNTVDETRRKAVSSIRPNPEVLKKLLAVEW